MVSGWYQDGMPYGLVVHLVPRECLGSYHPAALHRLFVPCQATSGKSTLSTLIFPCISCMCSRPLYRFFRYVSVDGSKYGRKVWALMSRLTCWIDADGPKTLLHRFIWPTNINKRGDWVVQLRRSFATPWGTTLLRPQGTDLENAAGVKVSAHNWGIAFDIWRTSLHCTCFCSALYITMFAHIISHIYLQ
jgi:hypothetical protein